MKTRIYEVPAIHPERANRPSLTETFLVEASSLAGARAHVANKFVAEASLPSGKRIAELMGQGIKVETIPDAPKTDPAAG